MPQKIFMSISNGNNNVALQAQQSAIQAAALTPAKKMSSALNTSMIKRIHNARPGCGSCGRKA